MLRVMRGLKLSCVTALPALISGTAQISLADNRADTFVDHFNASC
jgi:hypothetical protein